MATQGTEDKDKQNKKQNTTPAGHHNTPNKHKQHKQDMLPPTNSWR